MPPLSPSGPAIRPGDPETPRPQALMAAEAASQHGEELFAAGEAALVLVGAVLADMTVKAVPGKPLDDLFEHGSSVAHGIGSRCERTLGTAASAVESTSCPRTSTNRARQQWRRPAMTGRVQAVRTLRGYWLTVPKPPQAPSQTRRHRTAA